MEYHVSRTFSQRKTHNVVSLRRPRLAHISLLLKSNSGAVPLANRAYTIALDGEEREGVTDADGLVAEEDVLPGDYAMELEGLSAAFVIPTTPVHIRRRPFRVGSPLIEELENEPYDDDAPAESDDEVNYHVMGEAEDMDWEEVEAFQVGEQVT